jgi:hypothetical protein
MKSSRKHADAQTRRPETLPDTRRARATLLPRLAALACATFLTATFAQHAAARQSAGALGGEGRQRAAEAAGAAAASKLRAGAWGPGAVAGMPVGLDAPMRILLTGTPDEPVVFATIGDFPADLGANGEFFLRREFVEHFVTNVLDLGGPAHAAPMISFLSDAAENESECAFKVGGVSGRLSVLVTPRRVFVMCSFADEEQNTNNLAAATRPRNRAG